MQPSASIVNGSATINAPTSGVVTGISAVPNKTVQVGQQLLALGSGQEVEAVIQLNQNDLYLVHLGSSATIEIAQQTIVGQVSRIYPQVEANQSPSFLAHLKLTNVSTGLLKPGMTVNTSIVTGKTSMVPAVPTTSIFQDDQDRTFIYLAVGNKAKLQQVAIGATIGDLTEITTELPPGSLVITGNLADIKDGHAITIIN
jgi:RND family efflux transporter MFP subunit